MSKKRVVFMGTPGFAVPALRAMAETQDVVGVVTQPDAPAGRGGRLAAPPVKEFALQHGLSVLQPDSLKSPESVAHVADLRPDVIVVAAYGHILRRNMLDLPPAGCVNVHASLLPRWRGASPISAAIAAGDDVTGVTIMKMDAGLDSGPLIAQRGEPIAADDTTGSLTHRLALLGADLLAETLPLFLDGAITPVAQDESRVTLCRTLKKDDGRLDWSRPAAELERHVRAMAPWPGAFTAWNGKLLKVLRAAAAPRAVTGIGHGRVALERDRVFVACGDGAIELLEVQLEGKKAVAAGEFARGHRAVDAALLA